jgi:sporulation protein YlmC with PRC-barrel domain
MLKERFLTTVAAGAIAVAGFAISFAPDAVEAQQRQIITQPEASQESGAPTAPGAEDNQAQEGAGETMDQQAQDDAAQPLEEQAQDEAAEPKQNEQAEQDTGEAKETDRLAGSNMFLGEQDANEVVASALIGKALFNSQGERLGEINDLVIAEDGAVTAVIVGVGGFLGIGEKDVAVSYDAVSTSRSAESDEVLLIVDATAAELEAAPEFVTLAAKMEREEAERAAAQQQEQQQAPAPGAGAPQPLERPAPSND